MRRQPRAHRRHRRRLQLGPAARGGVRPRLRAQRHRRAQGPAAAGGGPGQHRLPRRRRDGPGDPGPRPDARGLPAARACGGSPRWPPRRCARRRTVPGSSDRVRQELDIPLRIIDAETEAALSYRSVAHHFPLAGERTARGRHRRRQPGADRRGGRAGRAHPLAPARRRAADRALPARRASGPPARDRGAPRTHPEAAQARALQRASGRRPPSSARAAPSPPWAA